MHQKKAEAKKQPPPKKETPAKTQPTANHNNNDTKEDTPKSESKQLSKNQQRKLKKLQKQQQAQSANDNKAKEETNETKEATSTTAPEKTNETVNDKTEPKEEQKIESNDQTKSAKKSANAEPKFPNGIDVKDLKPGTGDEIQNGQTLVLYYVGQLEDKKVFDKVLAGDGFEYKFGNEEPIKGWHLGMKGMKIGGKRRIILPPKFAYGAEGSAAKGVPANATVTFTIEVRSAK